MSNLASIFPSLILFSDLNWDTVTSEYEGHYIHMSFPEYLQAKADEGDCPPYLFEIAYYEQALFEASNADNAFPHQPGVYLNPTALFLSLEFDVVSMIADARKGQPTCIEKEHILVVYRDEAQNVHTLPLTQQELELLQQLEDGPMPDHNFLKGYSPLILQDLVRKRLILDLTQIPIQVP